MKLAYFTDFAQMTGSIAWELISPWCIQQATVKLNKANIRLTKKISAACVHCQILDTRTYILCTVQNPTSVAIRTSRIYAVQVNR